MQHESSKYGPVFMVKVADSLAFDSKLFTKSDFQSGVNYSIHLFFHVGKYLVGKVFNT